MKNITIILTVLVATTINAIAQENIKNNEKAERLCYVTFEDGSTYKVKNYCMQSIQDKVDYQNGQYKRYHDDSRSKTKYEYDYILLMLKPGIYKKVKFSEIEKLSFIKEKNNYPKCEILLMSGDILKGRYKPEGIQLDCSYYYFIVTKENGEEFKIEYKWLNKIEKDPTIGKLWHINYKQEKIYNNEPDYDTTTVAVTNIKWVTNKSAIVSYLRKYGENEIYSSLNVVVADNGQNKSQTVRVKFSDISTIDFFSGGKREIKLLDGTILKGTFDGEFKEYIQYFYGEVDEDLLMFAFIFYDRFSFKFE